MLFDRDLLFILSLVRMKSIILRLIIEIIITQPMFIAGYNCLKVFNVIVLFTQSLILIYQFLRIYKNVRNLLLHLAAYLYCYNRISFCFEEKFALSTLKKTKIRDLQSKVNFVIDTRQEVIKLFYFRHLYFEHRTRMFQKLLSSLLHLMTLQTDIACTVLTLLRSIEYF